MGYFFSLSAECGLNKADTENFAKHFRNVSWTLLNGQQFVCEAGIFQEAEGKSPYWWCSVLPKSFNGDYVDVFEDSEDMNVLSFLLYQRLITSPPFRYALVGVEVDEFRTYDELVSDQLIKDQPEKFNGLVVSEAIWKNLGSLSCFTNFKRDYFWIPLRRSVGWSG